MHSLATESQDGDCRHRDGCRRAYRHRARIVHGLGHYRQPRRRPGHRDRTGRCGRVRGQASSRTRRESRRPDVFDYGNGPRSGGQCRSAASPLRRTARQRTRQIASLGAIFLPIENPVQSSSLHRVSSRRAVVARLLLVVGIAPSALTIQQRASAAAPTIDLSTYVRIGRFDLPEPTRTAAPPNSLLAQEASGVTYNWDTDTLFIVGDGGTSVVQVTKTGMLVDSMTLAPGNSPQGTEFYDTEGITYVGGGKFVLMEERDRQANLFTYVPNTTLHRADVRTVKLGTTIGNI